MKSTVATVEQTPTKKIQAGGSPSLPANPPAPSTVSLREFYTRELARRVTEAEALAVDPQPEDRWYRLRVLAWIRRTERDLAGVNNNPKSTPTTKAAPTVADLIARANADPAGDEPAELRDAKSA